MPHPLWALVIIVAVHYGTSEALFAALAATAALLLGNLPPMTPGRPPLEMWLSAVSQPLGWFITGLGLGELAWRRIERIAQLEARVKDLAGDHAAITARHAALENSHRVLKERAASEVGTVVGLYQAARVLERRGPGDVLAGIAEIIRHVLKPRGFTVYALRDGVLEEIYAEGHPSGSARPERYTSAHPLYRSVVLGRRTMCAANREDEAVLAGDGIVAGPLLCSETDRIVGMLKIEAMDFETLNSELLRNFRALCEWLGSAYARAEAHAGSEAQQILNRERTVYSAGFFDHIAALMAALGRRANFEVSLAVVSLPEHDAIPEGERGTVSTAVAQAVRECLRETDIAFEYQRNGWEFAVLLPTTGLQDARQVGERLKARVDARLDGAGLRQRATIALESLSGHAYDTAQKASA